MSWLQLKSLVATGLATVLVGVNTGCARSAVGDTTEVVSTDYGPNSEQFADLLAACAQGDRATVDRLLSGSGSAMVNVQSAETGATALERATEFGHSELVSFLLSRGADPSLANKENHTPLIQAAYKGFLPIVDQLLEAGADVNASETRYGDSPLTMAAWKGHSDVVKRLIEAGADVNHRAKDGKTALLRAEQRGDQPMVAYLKEHGAT